MEEIYQKKERTSRLFFISKVFIFILIGYIFLIPYQYFKTPQIQIFNIFIAPVKYIPVVLIFFLLFFTIINPNIKKIVHKYKSINILIVTFIFLGFLSSFSAINITLSFTRLFYYTVTGVIITYYCFVNISSIYTIKLFSRFIILLGVIVTVYGIIEFILGRNILYSDIFNNSNYLFHELMAGHYPYSGQNSPYSGQDRIFSTIGHPVVLAFSLIPSIIFTFMEFAQANYFRKKIFLLLCGLLLIVGLFLTFSRGSWVAVIVIFFVYFWRKRKVFFSFILPILFIFVIIISLSDSIRSTLISRNPEVYMKRIKTNNRIMSYLTVAKIFSDYPLFGVGTANFRLIRWDYDEFSATTEAPDNMFLMILAENGILGLSVLILILSYILKNLKKTVNISEDVVTKELAWALFCIFIAFIINMLTFDVLYQPVSRIIFWTMTGFALVLSEKQ